MHHATAQLEATSRHVVQILRLPCPVQARPPIPNSFRMNLRTALKRNGSQLTVTLPSKYTFTWLFPSSFNGTTTSATGFAGTGLNPEMSAPLRFIWSATSIGPKNRAVFPPLVAIKTNCVPLSRLRAQEVTWCSLGPSFH